MKLRKCWLLIFVALLLKSGNISAQVESPPTLALGVAGVVGEKGSIDVDLLAEIISEKQGELKQEFIKKTFFNDLDDHSYVLWEFMYRTVNVLLESESKDAIKKNLLQNSANLALVYGFCEFYLHLSQKMGNSALDSLIFQYDAAHYTTRSFQYPPLNGNAASLSNFVSGPKVAQLSEYTHSVNGVRLDFSAVFIDLVFEVMRTDTAVVKELGLLNTPCPLGKNYYENTSAYYRLKRSGSDNLKKALEQMRLRLKNEIDLLMDNFMLLKKLSRSRGTLQEVLAQYKDELGQIAAKNRTSPTYQQMFDQLKAKSDSVFTDLGGLSRAFSPQLGTETVSGANRSGVTAIAVTEVRTDDRELAKEIAENLRAFAGFLGRKTQVDQYDIYYLEKSIMPLLVRLVAEKGLDSKYLQIANEFDKLITWKLLDQFNTQIAKGDFGRLTSFPISTFSDLLDFVTRLDELDEVETYQYVLDIIQNTSEVYSDRKLGLYLKTVIDNINTYTILDGENNRVEIAVEDIISRLYDKYANRQSGIFGLYFSIGLNQTLASDLTYTQRDPNTNTVVIEEVRSLGFASEKIGLKVKMIDFKWRRSFTVGETYYSRLTHNRHDVTRFRSDKPFVSDLYFVTYASGLLYQITNLKTAEQFNDPIVGTGIGVAFYNSLDLNIGYNWPLRSRSDFFERMDSGQLITLAFDIKITEYLSALGKKRKSKP